MNYKKLKHPLTQTIQEQVNSRTEYLACLRLTIEVKMLSHKPTERTAAKRLLLWLSPYKNNIYAPTIHTQSRMVKDLVEDKKESADIKQATTLLDFNELLEAILNINAKIEQTFLKRLDEKELYNVNGLAIRNAAYNDLKVLVNVLDVSYSLSTDDVQKEQLADLSLRINECLKDFQTIVRSRTTKKKNNREVEIAVKELIKDSSLEKHQEYNINDLSLVIDNQLNPSTRFATKALIDQKSNNLKDADEDVKGGKSGKNGKDIIPLENTEL